MTTDIDNDKQKTPKKRYNFRKRKNKKNYKIVEQSDDSDSDWYPVDEEVSDGEPDSLSEEEKEIPFNTRELQKFIQKIFPSKSGAARLQQLQKLDKLLEKEPKRKGRKKEREESDDDTYAEEKDSDEYILEDEDENMDEDEIRDMLANDMKFNIVFTIGEPTYETDLFTDDEDSDDEEQGDGKQKPVFNVGDEVMVKDKGWDEYYDGVIINICNNGSYHIKLDSKELDKRKWKGIKEKYIRPRKKKKEDQESLVIDELKELVKIRKKKGKKAMIKQFDKFMEIGEKKEKKKKRAADKKEKAKNIIKFRSQLREKNIMNDFKYFKNMDLEAQQKILKNLDDINKYSNIEKPYRLSILESSIPLAFKSYALKKINILSYMDSSTGEYYKIKQWVDTFMKIPFGKYKTLPIQMSDGLDKCSAFMDDAKKKLDKCVYGLEDAKMQIMQLIGQWISNPGSIGTAIAIKGPPGTGKTTLIKEGISAILQRPFSFLALGGATDSSFLEGHSYTYEGSNWGKVVDILIQSKCMNPVIYFDELDKISDTPKGEEITGILTHLTDTTQNTQFHDKYFSNIDFNVSKALFIFSYNDDKKVNPILKDRMYRIHTKGYEAKEKLIIAQDYLIPTIEKNVNFQKGEIIIPNKTLQNIIETFTEKEMGVRNLKRCLEILYTKINLFRLMKPESTLFEKQKVLKIEYPFTVTTDMANQLLKKSNEEGLPFGMYL